MKFAIVILALVAAASAQFNLGQYNPTQYNTGTNSPFSRKYKPYYSTPYPTYKPFVSTTPVPYFASSTYAPPTPVPVAVISKISQDARNAETLKYGNEINPDGSFNYFYETNGGIAVQEQGVPKNLGGNPPLTPVVVQGSYSFITPEGEQVDVKYVADENGYQPISAAIPTPPPVPELIARSLAYIAANAPLSSQK